MSDTLEKLSKKELAAHVRAFRARLERAEQRIKELDADYQRIIREVLACDPLPAKDRADNQLEPPWEVIARVRRERDEARRAHVSDISWWWLLLPIALFVVVIAGIAGDNPSGDDGNYD